MLCCVCGWKRRFIPEKFVFCDKLHRNQCLNCVFFLLGFVFSLCSWSMSNETYSSVVSSGNSDGTLVRLFSRQSTMPSAHRHGCGQLLVPPHSRGAFSVKPIDRYSMLKTYIYLNVITNECLKMKSHIAFCIFIDDATENK